MPSTGAALAFGADSQRYNASVALGETALPIAKAPQNGAFGAGATSQFHLH